MEIVGPSDAHGHQHRWLRWLGLKEPPAEPDAWVLVARGCPIDDFESRTSGTAWRLIDRLSTAGIEARQRSYEVDTIRVDMVGLPNGGIVTRIAVLVHNRDLARATEIATRLEEELSQESPDGLEVSGDELAR